LASKTFRMLQEGTGSGAGHFMFLPKRLSDSIAVGRTHSTRGKFVLGIRAMVLLSAAIIPLPVKTCGLRSLPTTGRFCSSCNIHLSHQGSC
jgi:hypothetical protein